MKFNIFKKNATVVNEGAVFKADVLIENNLIVKISTTAIHAGKVEML